MSDAPDRPLSLPVLLAVFLAAACVPPPEAPVPLAETLRLRIVHTNDVHGRLLPQEVDGRAAGGAAVLAAHLDSARARFDGAVIVLDGGDVMQGTAESNLAWGRPAVEVMGALRYDGVALGNHEFDWGLDTLRARVEEATYPWMGANVHLAGTDRHPEWVRPWTMVQRAGVRVGVIGISLATTPEIVMAGRTEGLDFGPEWEAIDRYAREARDAGAHFVVVTAHVGAVCEAPGEAPDELSRGCEGRIVEVVERITEPVDMVVAGHTHLRNLLRVRGVPISQALRYTLAYGITDLELAADSVRVLRQEIRWAWSDEVEPDATVATLVERWGERVRPLTERLVAELAHPLDNLDRAPRESSLGNLVADAQRSGTGAHVGLVNVGSLRRSLPAGPVSYGVLFELQPFQNELVTLTLSGRRLRAALEHALGEDGRPRAMVAGMTIRYDPAAPAGMRVHEIRLDDGRLLDGDQEVTLGTTEFVATGGDGFTMLAPVEPERTGLVDVDALVGWLESLPQPVEGPEVGRWLPRSHPSSPEAP